VRVGSRMRLRLDRPLVWGAMSIQHTNMFEQCSHITLPNTRMSVLEKTMRQIFDCKRLWLQYGSEVGHTEALHAHYTHFSGGPNSG
jgi:hypothetical protein